MESESPETLIEKFAIISFLVSPTLKQFLHFGQNPFNATIFKNKISDYYNNDTSLVF